MWKLEPTYDFRRSHLVCSEAITYFFQCFSLHLGHSMHSPGLVSWNVNFLSSLIITDTSMVLWGYEPWPWTPNQWLRCQIASKELCLWPLPVCLQRSFYHVLHSTNQNTFKLAFYRTAFLCFSHMFLTAGFLDADRMTSSSCTCVAQSLSHVWLFATLWIVASQAPLSMGFSRQNYWSMLPCPPPGNLPDPRIASLALAGGFFTTVPPGKCPFSWG